MEAIVAPPPPAPPTRRRNADTTSTTSPPSNHQPHLLRLPLRRNPKPKNLSLIHPSSQPITPPKKSKRRRKCDTTSHILPLMDALHFPITIDIYTSLVKECTLSTDPETAIELHTQIITRGIELPLTLLNRILIMFVSCGLLENARRVFDVMSVRDFHSWATLFVSYYENGEYENAIDVFVSMLCQLDVMGFSFPPWIWSCLLKACACTMNVPLGMQVHGCLLKLGACDHVLISSSLIRFYGRFKCLEDANMVFNRVSRHNTLTWTAKIVSSCRERHFSEALGDFKKMGRVGVKKDSFTFSSVLKACGRMQNRGSCGEQVHADAIKLGLDSDSYVQCSLIAMYGRSGLLRDAELVFEMTRNERNVDSLNAMLMGYIQNGLYIEAVKFVYQMKAAGVQPHEPLLEKLRIACGSSNFSSMN
ncbi:putative pentatricopeptide [Medicago truncatula]|uniref:PPR repeat protein n=1 Tax=Medicago truncatula TaxID=3880 RepID=G7K2Q2_MEDTR|nr:pentatricopeptide repeat-containing protein At1g31790 [Medicago truncatula]AES95415.1 PPR repeat protein [Medicago truncatula]RHN54526.1 putative pentatricopeptide [Medicago truncatula]